MAGAATKAARPSSAGGGSGGGNSPKDEPMLGWASRTLLLVLISVMAFSIR